MLKEQTTKKHLVVKANQLIEARYKLSVGEQKLVLYAISKIKPGDTVNTIYTFQIKEFAHCLGLTNDSKSIYRHLRLWTKNVMRKPMSLFPDPNTELQMNWFAVVKYEYNEGSVSFRFATELIPYLLDLKKQFTSYQLQNILQFRSSYSIRFYELLKQYQNIGKREILLTDLREMVGVEKSKFKRYNDFKRKVIEMAKKELDKNSDIKFDYDELKISRAVNAIKFTIKTNNRLEKQEEASSSSSEDLETLLALVPAAYKELKTVRSMIENFFNKKGFQYVNRNILYANKHSNQSGKYRAYLCKALKSDYGAAIEEDEKVQADVMKWIPKVGQKFKNIKTDQTLIVEDGGFIMLPSGAWPPGVISDLWKKGILVEINCSD